MWSRRNYEKNREENENGQRKYKKYAEKYVWGIPNMHDISVADFTSIFRFCVLLHKYSKISRKVNFITL